MAAAVVATRGNFSTSIRISDFDFRKLHFAKAIDELFFGHISATIGRKRKKERKWEREKSGEVEGKLSKAWQLQKLRANWNGIESFVI